MATRRVGRHNLRCRYKVAIEKYETDHHDQALEELFDLLMEVRLPLLIRLKANLALADGNAEKDWHLAEGYRKEAERVYESIRASTPTGDTRWPAYENELVALRESLDTLAEDQLANQPNDAELAAPALRPDDDGMDLPSSPRHTALSGGDSSKPESTFDSQSHEAYGSDMPAYSDEIIALRPRVSAATGLETPAPSSPKRRNVDGEPPESPSKKRKSDRR
ncbi:hypothetical protein Q7P37_006499 [Cladosporium fusiforme]